MLEDKKILITGATGVIARPAVELLARSNQVWALSKFDQGEAKARAELEAQGVECIPWDMGTSDVPSAIPTDITHVLHASMLRETDNYDAAIDVNGLAVARLMKRHQNAESFVFISSTAIYKHIAMDHRYKETDPYGGGLIFLPAYQVSKIAAEAVVRSLCSLYQLRTTIIRPGICYGAYSWGGVPIMFLKKMMAKEPIELPAHGNSYCMPVDVSDIARMLPAFWNAAAAPATIVNMSGDDMVSDEEYTGYIAKISGFPVTYKRGSYYRDNFPTDNTRREQIAGKCLVHWQDGMRAAIEAHFPGLIKCQ
jgi:nucleoside-diphosphate-sugar epimerase